MTTLEILALSTPVVAMCFMSVMALIERRYDRAPAAILDTSVPAGNQSRLPQLFDAMHDQHAQGPGSRGVEAAERTDNAGAQRLPAVE
jgi:hypothetical protein